jgi:3',5'-cyclic AMP phosphodiesterase CpdA
MTENFTIAHISDVHLSPIEGFHPRYWNVKRALGYLNWHRGRRWIHERPIADEIAADALRHEPDHVVVTGDLANLGLPAEYDAAFSWLAGLGPPERVSVVPGNHDIYTARMHGASCIERWRDFMESNPPGSEIVGKCAMRFPYVRIFGGIAIIGLNSAVPTPPFVAAGRVGGEQLARLARVLHACSDKGLTRLILIHHPPLPGLAPPRRALEDAAALARVLDEYGAELVLHGHNHRDMLNWRQRTRGHIPVVGVASGSASKPHKNETPARYNLIRVKGRGPRAEIEVRVRGVAGPNSPISEIAHHVLKFETSDIIR